jgi:glycosyltransferase involved in cell wall biosynthesis
MAITHSSTQTTGGRVLVSIIIANHNYGDFLPDAVKSVLEQTYTNWELIICDDGSTDHSPEVAQDLATLDSRISVHLKENGGQVSAWNLAYRHSRGEIICFLDSDDAFSSTKLERVVDSFSAAPSVGLAYHSCQFTDERLNPVERFAPRELPSGCLAQRAMQNGGQAMESKTSDFAIRRGVLDSLMPLPEDLKFADGYICRIAAFLTEIRAIPDCLSFYRIHHQNAMGSIDQLNEGRLQALAELLLATFEHQRRFLATRFGEHFSAQIRLEDHAGFWDVLGRLYILRGKPRDGVLGFSSSMMLNCLQKSRKRYFWSLLFALPHPLSQYILSTQVQVLESGMSTYRSLATRLHRSRIALGRFGSIAR